MKVELLQMATLMIRRAPGQLVQNRKEFIKFGWNNLKKDDSAVKYYAFQNVCHFFDAYAAPEKIVLQVGPEEKGPLQLALLSILLCDSDAASCSSPYNRICTHLVASKLSQRCSMDDQCEAFLFL